MSNFSTEVKPQIQDVADKLKVFQVIGLLVLDVDHNMWGTELLWWMPAVSKHFLSSLLCGGDV